VRRVTDLIGRADLLDARGHRALEGEGPRFLEDLPPAAGAGGEEVPLRDAGPRSGQSARQSPDRARAAALERREKVTIEMPIRNINRTVGTMSGEIAKRHGHEGLPDERCMCGSRARQ
jgi:glutamate synthase (NADPH/NADH) large chain